MSEDKTLTKIPHFDGHWSELMKFCSEQWVNGVVEIGFSKPVEGTMLRNKRATLMMLDSKITK